MTAHDEGQFSSKDGTRLHWRFCPAAGAPASAVVALVHGYGDHSGRYVKTMNSLAASGFSTCAFDYRGHGKAEGPRADCLHWSDYLDDLEAFWVKVREAAGSAPTFLLAHSHGALMATHWAARAPQGLQGLILTSPYYQLAFVPPALKVAAARLIRGVLPGLRLGNEIKLEDISRDVEWQRQTQNDPLYLRVTTPRWYFEHLAAQERLAGLGQKLTGPLLMLAGTGDRIASMPAAKAFFETVAASDKTWKEFPDYRHEILNELGKEACLAEISRWISAHC